MNNRRGYLSKRNSRSAGSAFPGMWTEDGKYLNENVADILIRALADVNENRPKDPIGYLAANLYTLRYIPQNDPQHDSMKSKTRLDTNSEAGDESTMARKMIFDRESWDKVEPNKEFKSQNDQLIKKHRTENGESILHFIASQSNQEEVLLRLLSHASNASLADRNNHFKTPRDVASANELQQNVLEIDKWVLHQITQDKTDVVKELVINGYDSLLDLEGNDGINIIEVARKSNNNTMVEFLRQAADFEDRRDFLHRAIKVGSLTHVEYMADSEDLVRSKDNKGRTSLHIATLCEEKPIMSFIAEKYPAILNVGDNLGRTPLHYAMAVDGVDEVAKILVQAGARRTTKDLRGKLPSYYFMNRGEIVDMIKELYNDEETDIAE